MRQSTSPVPTASDNTKSVRDTLRQLNKRKSINTINRFLTGSAQRTENATHQRQQQHQQRPRSVLLYADGLNDMPEQRTLNGFVARHPPHNTTDIITPTSSFLNHRASATAQQTQQVRPEQEQQQHYLYQYQATKLAQYHRRQQQQQQQKHISATASYSADYSTRGSVRVSQHNSNDRNDENDYNTSSYRPSVHPTQTMSYEIKTGTDEKANRNGDSIEERVNLLCVALAQGIESPPKNSNRPDSQVPRPTVSNKANRSLTLIQEPILDMTKQHYQNDQQKQSTLPTRSSPVSLASLSSASTSPANLESLMKEVEQMKHDFDKRLSQIIQDYERTSFVVHQLSRDLQMREEELSGMRMKYENAVEENSLLYEAFNSELEQILSMTTHQELGKMQQSLGNDTSNDSRLCDHPETKSPTEPSNQHGDDIHSSEKSQWKRKIEMTIKERNQWHRTACQLARELQDVTVYFSGLTTEDKMQNVDDAKKKLTSFSNGHPAAALLPQSSVSSPMSGRHI